MYMIFNKRNGQLGLQYASPISYNKGQHIMPSETLIYTV